jgi:5'-methylthioadenosine phosphorylase
MSNGNIAIIGGTGFETLPPDIFAESIDLETRFGSARVLSVSDNYTEPYKLYFLSRHGAGHGLAPHQINYRANIVALQELGVQSVFATNAVGSLRLDVPPGNVVLFDDFLDFTRHRDISLFTEHDRWRHTDLSVPYSPRLRHAVRAAASALGIQIRETGTYVCCDGPRFESPAEIRMYAGLGGDVVGMTGVPEVVMAREAGIDYAGIGIVTNFGAGLTTAEVSHDAVVAAMTESVGQVRDLLMIAAHNLME